jgi:predicted TIM-barrel fold metal-dependent hydrolase
VIIDFHAHVFSPAMRERREDLCRQDACFATLYSNPASKISSAEELLDSMDACGIDVSVIQNIGWVNDDLCVESNDYILEKAARYSGRLLGFCTCQPRSRDSSLREVERCLQGGARGIGEMRPDIQGYDLSDAEVMNPLVKYSMRHGMIFTLHASEPVGHQYAGKGTMHPKALYEFACQYPELTFVTAHLGGGLPFYEAMTEVADRLKNVYYDTAAIPLLYKPVVVKSLTDILGDRKILFGSDWPLISQSRVLGFIMESGISTGTLDLITNRNAKKLLKL